MIDSQQIMEYLALNKSRFQKDYHLTKIGVFGSISRDEQKEGSDIDLIVEFKDNTPDLYGIKQRLREELVNEFNVHVDICREKYIKPVFKKQIMTDAKYV